MSKQNHSITVDASYVTEEFPFTESDKIKIHTAANLYVKHGQKPENIARTIGIPLLTFKEWCESPAWKEACEFWGFTAEDARPLHKRIHEPRRETTPPPRLRPPRENMTPFPLTEKYLLEQAFQKEGKVRIITYAKKYKDANVESVGRYELNLTEGNPLKKLNVLMAYPDVSHDEIKKSKGIVRRPSIAEQNLSPIVSKKDRPKVEIRAKIGETIECVLRNGLVVTGRNLWISKYTIVMRAGAKGKRRGKVVLIYMHGVLEFNVIKDAPKTRKDDDDFFDDE